jgi:glycosyltransferase involved in cell wall biosynthesis
MASLYEGFGLPVLEAMACGIPVIASHSSSIPEVAGDAAALVDPYDIPRMAEVIATILADQGKRDRMSREGLQQAERFTWGKTAESILRILHEVGAR